MTKKNDFEPIIMYIHDDICKISTNRLEGVFDHV